MQLLTLTKALADESRVRLVNLLLAHELSVSELVQTLGLPQPSISRHLKLLADAGLADVRRDGQWAFYRAPESGPARRLLDCAAFLFDPEAPGNTRLGRDREAAARVVAERAARSARFFNAIAQDWSRLRSEHLGGFALAPLLASRLPRSAMAADLGCGTGELLPVLLERAERVIGVDNSQRMLDLAAKALAGSPDAGRVSLRLGDLEHLPLGDAEAEAAMLSLVLHHLSSPPAALAEARRVLAPGGTLLLADFEKHAEEAMRARYGDRWLGFEAEELARWLQAAGFDVAETARFTLPTGLVLALFRAVKPA